MEQREQVSNIRRERPQLVGDAVFLIDSLVGPMPTVSETPQLVDRGIVPEQIAETAPEQPLASVTDISEAQKRVAAIYDKEENDVPEAA